MRLRFVPFLILLLLGSCADGGSRGTGITTAQGNVVSVVVATRPPSVPKTFLARAIDLLRIPREASADGNLGGIQVFVDGSEFAGVTDPNGLFSVQGGFGGPTVLRFFRPQDGLDARLVIDPPAGATLTLSDVRLDRGQARPARRDIDFDGLVVGTRCPEERVTTVSRFRPGDGNSYVVRVGGSALRDERGNPVSCTSLVGGETLRTAGIVNDDGTIGAYEARVRESESHGGNPSGPSEPDDPDDPDDVSESEEPDVSAPDDGDDD